MNKPIISLIVAYSDNQVIGIDNTLPWKLPADLAYFKKTTMGKPIIMGRKTWESLGRPLPGRLNIVISRNSNYQPEGAQCVESLADALKLVTDQDEVFIIGGAQIYAQTLNDADRVYATEVHTTIEGDAFFPVIDKTVWQEKSRDVQEVQNGLAFDFVLYEKR